MNYSKFVYWAPRVMSVIFVLFISLFAFDVFEEGVGWKSILGFLIHLIPSYVLILTAIIAWKRDLFGAIAYFSFTLLYVILARTGQHWGAYASICGPAIFTSILFFLNWREKRAQAQTIDKNHNL